MNLSETGGDAEISSFYVFAYSIQMVECAAEIFYVCEEGFIGNVLCEFERNRKRRRIRF